MRSFDYRRADSLAAAREGLGEAAQIIAGGTNLLDLMKLQVMTPKQLLDINRVPGLREITETENGLKIGALVSNSDLAADPRIRSDYPVLARAILAGASGQIRNKATTGGNFLQRTRCPYFYDTSMACNKRQPGSSCTAIGGISRMTAILGVSEHCIAAHPSDMAVAMRALDARLDVADATGDVRQVGMDELYCLPGERPDIETTLAPDDIITAVHLPQKQSGAVHVYRKVRDRASYAFALVSVAAIVTRREQRIATAALAFGGIGSRPWRNSEVDEMLAGEVPGEPLFAAAADRLLAEARTEEGNAFKTRLTRRTMISVLREATGLEPASVGTDRVEESAA
ncbi:FAD binding domain-containing protein [Pseudohoeflea coraliihabitans]|uniref:Xanthine dehydrogenase family protein subunit M n=1 Tax=Pseudohoeflea coraliihabitans TaxID=2860393 RepID=A0ABS6WKY2_9HYPH|nr:xanthine dehydrogenase family protein subunit M [Pseudohoeflea sp. DP4N28-3]MBW3096602.1 xanthine dehydrogenase family protein subunit M [Pseudohoeflea sp. DP4N28-3]